MRFRWQAVIAMAAAVLVSGCTSTPGKPAPAPQSPPAAPTATSRGLPSAADGTSLDACRDGRCEVLVRPDAQIPVPAESQVDSVRIQAIGPDTVTVAGRTLGDSQGGYCTGNCSSSGSDGGFQLTLGSGGEGSENHLDVTLVAVADGLAVLRFAPTT